EWFDFIYDSFGLFANESDYYVAGKDGKVAIFNKRGKMVSPEWFDDVNEEYGLVRGQSNLYIAMKDGKEAIFDVDGNQITKWFDRIEARDLVKGRSDYYIACDGEECAVYHKNGQKVSEDFSREEIKKAKKITFNDNLSIVELFNEKRNLVKTIDFYPYKEEILDYT
ncbi:MAG: hypothetical protein ACP5GK_09425, partial [Desulfurella sp.]